MAKNEKVLTQNKKVRQANEFIESPYAVELTTHEIKTIEYLIAECTEDDYALVGKKQGKEYTFSATQLAKILNTSLSRVVADGDKLSNDITQKRIIHKLYDEKKNLEQFEYMSIIISAKYKSGTFSFELNYKILPFFININKNFTEYQLKYLLSMRNAYAIKLYKLLYQYKNIGNRKFDLEDLKNQFGIKDKYPFYKDFRKRILDPSILQINELTDLNVEYNEIKFGRKVEKIDFIFDIKKKLITNKTISLNESGDDNIYSSKPKSDNLLDLSNLLGTIMDKISSDTKQIISKYYEEKGEDYVKASIKYAQKNSKTNIDKYLKDTLSNGWAEIELNKLASQNAKKNAIKQTETKKLIEKDQEKFNKLLIEQEWSKLSDTDKQQYIEYANSIRATHKEPLKVFNNLEYSLPLSIYAVSNKKTYDKIQESYMQKLLKINLKV